MLSCPRERFRGVSRCGAWYANSRSCKYRLSFVTKTRLAADSPVTCQYISSWRQPRLEWEIPPEMPIGALPATSGIGARALRRAYRRLFPIWLAPEWPTKSDAALSIHARTLTVYRRTPLRRFHRRQVQRFQQTLPLAHDQFEQIQPEAERQQARPQFHIRRNAAPRRVERVAGLHAEASAGGRRDLAQQRLVVAVLPHLVLLPVEAPLGEGVRIHQRTHAEESLILPDSQSPAIVAGRHLAH